MPQKKAKLPLPKAAQIIPEQIHLIRITITNAQVNGPSELPVEWKDVKMKIEASTLFDKVKECKIILCIDLFKEHDDPAKQIKANFTIEFFLVVDNMEDFVLRKSETEYLLDGRLGSTLLGIVYSTARGIILTRTAGTILQGIILPVVDPADLLV